MKRHFQLSAFASASTTAEQLEKTIGDAPSVAWVLGSGLSGLTKRINVAGRLPFHQIKGMVPPSVAGHRGELVFGEHQGDEVAILAGRIHLYEGHSTAEVVHAVRSLALWGVRRVIVTNAAGGINPSFTPGNLMLIDDHLNLTGKSPLLGPNEEEYGPRFVDMTYAYDRGIYSALREAASQLQLDLKTGVYAGLLGPSYETPAEVRMLRTLGADAVGMSTVLEVLALRHLGVEVGGISCITNYAAHRAQAPLEHREVEEIAKKAEKSLGDLLLSATTKLARQD